MSTLPRDVKRSIDKANKIADSMAEAKKTAEAESVKTSFNRWGVADGEKPPENKAQEEVKPAEKPAEAKPEPAEKPAEQTPPEDDWRKKYEVLQGKYNAEVPRLSKQVRGLNDELQRVRDILASSAEAPRPQVAETTARPFVSKKLLTPQEVEDYGEELITVVKKAAKEEFLPELERIQEENQKLRQQLGSVNEKVALSDRQKVFAKLDNDVKDWQTLNSDEGFLSWLNDIDPYSGQTRKTLLDSAFNSNNADRVAAFFTGYLREHAAVTTPLGEASSAPQREPILSLGSLAAPGRNRTATTDGAQQGQRSWTQGEIAAFYRDVQRGAFKGREKERLQIERSIVSAGKQGLVR